MEELTQKVFLERTPPGTTVIVSDLESRDRDGSVRVRTPELELHCSNCGGQRFFAPTAVSEFVGQKKPFDSFLSYVCRNCRKDTKSFALAGSFKEEKWALFKYGEAPPFGPPTPARAIALIGPDREQFLKGRRCENLGLGVGAFVYYRRVVESQRDRIFDEVIRVSRHIGADEQFLQEMESAKKEPQFTKAVEMIKKGLPQSLLINGRNPLLLLHAALSEGVHEMNDEQCLAVASSVRVVLVEFAERLGQAMKDEKELSDAVSRLSAPKKA